MQLSGEFGRAFVLVTATAPDFIVEAEIGAYTGDWANAPILVIRGTNSENCVGLSVTATGRVQIVKRSGGSGSTLSLAPTGVVAVGDKLSALAKSDGTFSAYLNGTLLTTASDTQFLTTGTRCGVGLAFSSPTAPKTIGWDNFVSRVPGDLR
ncbi:hypothetical protein [Pseudoclavibacter sp. RFBA6]|uniref:hypothetical protein n=1 Tax=Pseudoclavibacter sp. RFBA6 TaxID=2080573 RepID=UPI000D4BD9E7|nr:hypothetical protein [Pseudoclavibacter sp. RFBA6]PPG38020.1 hypothetical protein C5C17_15305 [Pseudoclavibacter sp. RFBA6]